MTPVNRNACNNMTSVFLHFWSTWLVQVWVCACGVLLKLFRNWESALAQVPEVSQKFLISAAGKKVWCDDEATHSNRPENLLFLVFLKTNARNTSKKCLVESFGYKELRTKVIRYQFFYFKIPRNFPFFPSICDTYKAIITHTRR